MTLTNCNRSERAISEGQVLNPTDTGGALANAAGRRVPFIEPAPSPGRYVRAMPFGSITSRQGGDTMS